MIANQTVVGEPLLDAIRDRAKPLARELSHRLAGDRISAAQATRTASAG